MCASMSMFVSVSMPISISRCMCRCLCMHVMQAYDSSCQIANTPKDYTRQSRLRFMCNRSPIRSPEKHPFKIIPSHEPLR